jgi:hypothetical protein
MIAEEGPIANPLVRNTAFSETGPSTILLPDMQQTYFADFFDAGTQPSL